MIDTTGASVPILDAMTPATNHQTESDGLLARAFTHRLEQLGLSRREIVRRSGLSRQTLHNIEHGEHGELKPSTLAAIDRVLRWMPGTALALSRGDASALESGDALNESDRASAYRWGIVERIQSMSLAELERMIANMDTAASNGDDAATESHDDFMARADERIRALEQALLNHANR